MTPNEINRAIALHLGWIPCHKRDCKNHWTNPCGTESNLPDYCGDLNAIHEAEKTLDEEQTFTQIQLLLPPPFCDKPSWRGVAMILQATAAQRAEAFLRTVGKWEE